MTATDRRRYRNQTPAATPVSSPVASSSGSNAATPASIGERVSAGPLSIAVREVVTGSDATEMVLSAWDGNPAPFDGFSNVVVRIEVRNEGDAAIAVDNDDFGFATSARRIWARLGLVPPSPSLNAVLEPGDSAEGWVAGQIEDGDDQLLMSFNCRALGGRWSGRFIALTEGASLPLEPADVLSPNEAGSRIGSPAAIGERVVTGDWAVTISSVAFADDVVALFPEEDYRTTALASADPTVIPFWIAFHMEVRHAGNVDTPLHFPVDAFNLAQEDGIAVSDVRILSAPLPELSGDYLPGGAGTGWYAIELPVGSTGNILRFQTFRTDADVRFLTWASGSASPVPEPNGT